MCGICLPIGMLNTDNRQAVSRCLDCSKLLCVNCVDLHKRTKVTKGHSIIDLEDEKNIECKVHQDEVVRFYCEPCDTCICVVCTFQEHKGHEVSSFSEGMHKYRQSMDQLMTVCKERVNQLQTRLEMITKCESVIRQAEERIRDTAIESISAIRKREKQMLEDLRVAYGDETMEYIKQKSTLQEALDNLVSTCNMTDIILKDKGVELLVLKNEIQEKLEVLVEVQEIPPPENIAKHVKFRPGSMVFGSLNFIEPGATTEIDGIDGDMCSLPTMNGCDCMVQTDSISAQDRATSIDQLTSWDSTESSEPNTDTGLPPLKKLRRDVTYMDSATSPVETLFHDCATNTWKPQFYESFTMTDLVCSMKRKTQTDIVHHSDNFTEMPKIRHSDSCTNTKRYDLREQGTSTAPVHINSRTTDTTGLILLNNVRIGTPCVTIAHSTTTTEPILVQNKWTTTDLPNISDKKTGTPKVLQRDEETCTKPLPVCLDMGVGGYVPGVDKASATVTIVTTDSSSGDHEATTCHVGVSTEWSGDIGTSRGFLGGDIKEGLFELEIEDEIRDTVVTEYISQGTITDEYIPQNFVEGLITRAIIPNNATYHDACNQTDHFITVDDSDNRQTPQTEMPGTMDNQVMGTYDSKILTMEITYNWKEIGPDMCNDKSTSTDQSGYSDFGTQVAHISTNHVFTNTDPFDYYNLANPAVRAVLADKGTEMTTPPMASIETNTPVLQTEDKITYTDHTATEDRSTEMPPTLHQHANTNTPIVEHQDSETSTFVPSLEKATYMPQPVLISMGTSTPMVISGDKGVGTEKVDTRDWFSMTPSIHTQEQETTTEVTPIVDCATNTVPTATRDASTDLYRGIIRDSSTSTQIFTNEMSTETENIMKSELISVGNNTSLIETAEAGVGTALVSTSDAAVHTKPVTKDVGIFKRPHTVTRRVGTPYVCYSEHGTLTDKCHTREKFSMTEVVTSDTRETSTEGLIKRQTCATETNTIQTRENCTYMRQKQYTDRPSSPVRPCLVERASSPIHIYGEDKEVSAIARSRDMGVSTPKVYISEKETNTTDVVHHDRACSPRRPFRFDMGTSTPIKSYTSQAVATEPPKSKNVGLNTLPPDVVDTACDPIRRLSANVSVTAKPRTDDKNTGTKHIRWEHKRTGTAAIQSVDSSTEMPSISLVDKEIGTPHVQMIHKNMSTDMINTVEKQTSTTDVAATYKSLIDTSETPKTFMNRSTSTKSVETVDREVSPIHRNSEERATSPVHRPQSDKSTLVKQADLMVPVERFQRAGMVRRLGQEGDEYTPCLTSICEDSIESSSDEELASLRRVGTLDNLDIVHTEKMWGAARNGTPGTPTESTFSTIGSQTSSSIRCHVNTGTSTPPVQTEDKAISTESYLINGKMAECISKLRTVSQRLETHSNFGLADTSGGPIYSRANITSQQSVSLPSTALPSINQVGMRSCSTGAETRVTTVHDRSKSVGDGDGQTVVPPFFTPPIQRRLPESAFWSPGLKHKARKQRIEISQMLQSSQNLESVTEGATAAAPEQGALSEQSTSSEAHINKKGVESDTDKPKKKKKNDKRVRKKSGGSSSPFSSPERLKERLQRVMPAFETPPKKAREKIMSPRSRSEQQKPHIDRRAKAQIRDAMKASAKSREVTPPPPKRTTSLMERVSNIGRRLRRTPTPTGSTPEESPTVPRRGSGGRGPGRAEAKGKKSAKPRVTVKMTDSARQKMAHKSKPPKKGAVATLLTQSFSSFDEEREDSNGDADDDNISRESII